MPRGGSFATRLKKEPGAPLGFVDPYLDEAGGGDVAVLVAHVMRLAKARRKVLVVLAQLVQEQMVVAKVRSTHVPVEVLGLHVEREHVRQDSVHCRGDVLRRCGAQVGASSERSLAAELEVGLGFLERFVHDRRPWLCNHGNVPADYRGTPCSTCNDLVRCLRACDSLRLTFRLRGLC